MHRIRNENSYYRNYGKNVNYSDVCMEGVGKIKRMINLDTQRSWVAGFSPTGSDPVSEPMWRFMHRSLYNYIHNVFIRLKDSLKGLPTTRSL